MVGVGQAPDIQDMECTSFQLSALPHLDAHGRSQERGAPVQRCRQRHGSCVHRGAAHTCQQNIPEVVNEDALSNQEVCWQIQGTLTAWKVSMQKHLPMMARRMRQAARNVCGCSTLAMNPNRAVLMQTCSKTHGPLTSTWVLYRQEQHVL